jgi:tellurite resistance protein TehA-like permease
MSTGKRKFNNCAFVSIGTFLFFIGLVASGIMLQITEHQPLSLLKIYSKVLHNFTAIAFLVFAVCHLIKNRKAMKTHITGIKKKVIGKEMLFGLLLFGIITGGCLILSYFLIDLHGINI